MKPRQYASMDVFVTEETVHLSETCKACAKNQQDNQGWL